MRELGLALTYAIGARRQRRRGPHKGNENRLARIASGGRRSDGEANSHGHREDRGEIGRWIGISGLRER
jgi:hypothetical protein